MIKSFKTFCEETKGKTLVVTFGRFNPPTIGHGKLFKAVSDAARRSGGDYRIYASQSVDEKKNPLSYEDKIGFLKKMFPEHGGNFILDRDVKNVFQVASKAYEDGYSSLVLVVGSDRVPEFETTLKKYEGVKGAHGFYDFEDGIKILSAGDRDPDSEDAVEGMSASKMRAAAADNDLQAFAAGLPAGFKGTKDLLNAVRKGMGLSKTESFRRHVSLGTNDLREAYVNGSLFKIGDVVTCKKTRSDYEIVERFSNYVSARCLITGGTKKYFLGDLIPSEQ